MSEHRDGIDPAQLASTEQGFSMAEWMARDAELESLRGDPEFESLVNHARRNADAQQ